MTKQLPGFKHGLLLILISLLFSLIVGGIGLLIVKFIPAFQPWNMLFSYVGIFTLTFFAVRYMWQNKVIEQKQVPFSIYLYLLPAIIGMLVITESVVSLIPMPQFVVDYFEKMVQLDLPGYLTVGLAAPILEELIFRGVILKGFLKKYNPTKAIIFSSVLFGLAHLNPWQFIAAFGAGIVMGWIYYKTKSIWPVIFIHVVNNSFSFYIAYAYNDINASFYEIAGGFMNYAALLIGSMFVCYTIYLVLKKIFDNNTKLETT